MKESRAFWDLLGNKRTPIVVLQGGSGSGKTISALQRIIHRATRQQGTITSIVSETLPQLKKGAMRDFFKILEEEKIYNPANHNKTENIYSFGKSKVEFFSTDNQENVLGGRRDYLFINEAIRIGWDTAYTLMRYTNIQSIIDFNPIYEFWAHKELVQITGTKFLNYTYTDNPYLPEMQRELLLQRARHDKYFERVFVKGLVGKREGLIYPDYALIDTFPAEIDYCYGLDFGYNHPTVLMKVCAKEKNLFWHEEIYKSLMTTAELISLLEKKIPNKKKEIFADPSRPEIIEAIFRAGFNIKKANNNIANGINEVKSNSLFITKDSTNSLSEISQYHWKVDKNENPIDEPVKTFDDAMDAARYGTMGAVGQRKILPPQYSYR